MTSVPTAKRARLSSTLPSSSSTNLYDVSNTDSTLIYIPFHDFPVSQTKPYQPSTLSANRNQASDEDKDQMVLLQLPKGLSVEDLSSSCSVNTVLNQLQDNNDDTLSSVHIVGPSLDETNNTNESSSTPSSICCLVVEPTGKSYSLSRVETSNALIVLPPPSKSSNVTCDKSNEQIKLHGRWIADPSSSFLECKSYSLNIDKLHHLLSSHVYNPLEEQDSNHDIIKDHLIFGVSVQELSIKCQVSTHQIQTALIQLHAYEHHQNHKFGLLHEQVEFQVMEAIIAVLVEQDDMNTMSKTSTSNKDTHMKEGAMQVSKKELASKTIGILQEQYPPNSKNGINDWYDNVVQHCINSLLFQDDENTETAVDKKDQIWLDIQKVAIKIAHQLFLSQSTPWSCTLFVQEWYNRMPGVGPMFEPTLESLKGIAYTYMRKSEIQTLNKSIFAKEDYIPNTATSTKSSTQNQTLEENEIEYLKYFPESKLSLNPKTRFRALFQEKEEWTLQELEHYINPLANYRVNSISDAVPIKQQWLIQYTYQMAEEEGITKYRLR